MVRSFVLCAVALLAGCAAVPASSPAINGAATSAAVPANDGLDAVAWTQTAVEHDLIYREVYRDAQDRLLQALADPAWDALTPADRDGHALAGLKPAVVLDIDETVLDNSPYQARLVRDGREYSSASWNAWVKEKAARALPGAVAFTRFAAAHGIAVIYISNRDQSLDADTLANLRQQGFPVSGSEAFLGLGTLVPGCTQVGTGKSCRRRLIAQHYRVLMQFGDQLGDFLSVPVNTPAARRQRVAPYLDWIGERWFVLPNVTYGDWQPALFHNDWSQPAQQRRQETLQALRYQ